MPTDNKVMAGVVVVLGLTLIGLLTALVLPVAIGGLNQPSTETLNQSEGQTVELSGTLNATLDSATTGSPGTIDVTVNHTDGGSASVTGLGAGSNETVTVGGEDVTVHNNEVTSGSSAEVTYEYPKTSGLSPGAAALYDNLGLIIVLVLFLTVIGWAVGAYKKNS